MVMSHVFNIGKKQVCLKEMGLVHLGSLVTVRICFEIEGRCS